MPYRSTVVARKEWREREERLPPKSPAFRDVAKPAHLAARAVADFEVGG